MYCYDRSRIKRGDIFSPEYSLLSLSLGEIEVESDKPEARIFLLLFSIILQVTRIRRTAFYQRGYGTLSSPLFSLPVSFGYVQFLS